MKRLLLASLLIGPFTVWHATAAAKPNIFLLLPLARALQAVEFKAGWIAGF
jgi:hypothetical protein